MARAKKNRCGIHLQRIKVIWNALEGGNDGIQSSRFDVRDAKDIEVVNGLYFYRIEAYIPAAGSRDLEDELQRRGCCFWGSLIKEEKMKRLGYLILAGFTLLGIVGIASAIPQLINYQGYLTDDVGNPVADGDYSLTFRIWDAETGPNQLWSEDHPTVSVAHGLFNVILGSISPLDLPFDIDYWLGIEVGLEPELPRIRLTSVAYSYRADVADNAVSASHAAYADSATHSVHADTAFWTLGGGSAAYADTAGYAFRADTANYALSAPGVPDDDWVITGDTIYRLDGNVGIGLTSPSTKLDVSGDINTDSPYKIGGATVLSVLGTENTLAGVDAGANNTGSYGTLVGYHAGYNNQGNYNTFIGHSAGLANTTGWQNTFLGRGAGLVNTTGVGNTFLGYGVGRSNTTGGSNTFVGGGAGLFNTTGYNNTFVGAGAGYSNTEGSSNIFLGSSAGYENTTGNNNVFVGLTAGYSNTEGSANIFLGGSAGYENTTGYNNIFVGGLAGASNTNGAANVFIGGSAGWANTNGTNNTFVGPNAGAYNTSGNSNTFLGNFAGYNNTRGDRNTFIGLNAGFSDSTGNDNVFIGFEAGYFETGSGKLYIANGRDTANVLIYGDFAGDRVGINTTNPAYTLDVNGDINVAGSYNVKKGGVDYSHPDYVFEPDYKLMSLDELREYVHEHKSLPNVVSAEEVQKNDGFKMDELLIQVLEKVEEQTLYILQLEERITELERQETSVTKGGN